MYRVISSSDYIFVTINLWSSIGLHFTMWKQCFFHVFVHCVQLITWMWTHVNKGSTNTRLRHKQGTFQVISLNQSGSEMRFNEIHHLMLHSSTYSSAATLSSWKSLPSLPLSFFLSLRPRWPCRKYDRIWVSLLMTMSLVVRVVCD